MSRPIASPGWPRCVPDGSAVVTAVASGFFAVPPPCRLRLSAFAGSARRPSAPLLRPFFLPRLAEFPALSFLVRPSAPSLAPSCRLSSFSPLRVFRVFAVAFLFWPRVSTFRRIPARRVSPADRFGPLLGPIFLFPFRLPGRFFFASLCLLSPSPSSALFAVPLPVACSLLYALVYHFPRQLQTSRRPAFDSSLYFDSLARLDVHLCSLYSTFIQVPSRRIFPRFLPEPWPPLCTACPGASPLTCSCTPALIAYLRCCLRFSPVLCWSCFVGALGSGLLFMPLPRHHLLLRFRLFVAFFLGRVHLPIVQTFAHPHGGPASPLPRPSSRHACLRAVPTCVHPMGLSAHPPQIGLLSWLSPLESPISVLPLPRAVGPSALAPSCSTRILLPRHSSFPSKAP